MKKLLFILALTLCLNAFGQHHERIKALKIAFITERLQLTETEAQQFWPVYNAFDEKNQTLRQENLGRFRSVDVESLSESDAKTLLQNIIAKEEKRHELRETFMTDLMAILPAKKIILLKAAEDDFKRQMMERLRKRHEGFRNNKP